MSCQVFVCVLVHIAAIELFDFVELVNKNFQFMYSSAYVRTVRVLHHLCEDYFRCNIYTICEFVCLFCCFFFGLFVLCFNLRFSNNKLHCNSFNIIPFKPLPFHICIHWLSIVYIVKYLIFYNNTLEFVCVCVCCLKIMNNNKKDRPSNRWCNLKKRRTCKSYNSIHNLMVFHFFFFYEWNKMS